MQERELMDKLLSDPGAQLNCRDGVVYWGTEAIGSMRDGQFLPAVAASTDGTGLLRDVIDWKLRKDLILRRLLRSPARESSPL